MCSFPKNGLEIETSSRIVKAIWQIISKLGAKCPCISKIPSGQNIRPDGIETMEERDRGGRSLWDSVYEKQG